MTHEEINQLQCKKQTLLCTVSDAVIIAADLFPCGRYLAPIIPSGEDALQVIYVW